MDAPEGEPLGYDEIIRMRDMRWGSVSFGCGSIVNFKGRAVALPKIEWLSFYRGQTKDYGELHAGLYRTPDPYVRAVNMAKMREFEHIILGIPSLKEFIRQGTLVAAIAQHYGLVTDYLDISGSFAVALFFATCRWCPDTGRYRPLNHREIRENPVGVVYSVPEFLFPQDDLEIVGFTQIPRPSCQQAAMIRDRGDGRLDGMFSRMYFRHSVRLSNEMYGFFHRGDDLFPGFDSAALSDITGRLRNMTVVNRRFYLDACREMGIDGTDEELMSRAEGYGFTDGVLEIRPEISMAIDMDISGSDFIRNTGVRFTARLAYREGIPDRPKEGTDKD